MYVKKARIENIKGFGEGELGVDLDLEKPGESMLDGQFYHSMIKFFRNAYETWSLSRFKQILGFRVCASLRPE